MFFVQNLAPGFFISLINFQLYIQRFAYTKTVCRFVDTLGLSINYCLEAQKLFCLIIFVIYYLCTFVRTKVPKNAGEGGRSLQPLVAALAYLPRPDPPSNLRVFYCINCVALQASP